jgi:hypothetical protein
MMACGGGPAQSGAQVKIEPETTTLSAGGAQQFSAAVTGATDGSVAWSVSEGSSGGSITASGLYIAPNASGLFHIIATSNADRSVFGEAAVVVNALSPVAIDVSPQSVTIAPQSTARFTAQVSGTNDTRVEWSSESGTMQQDGTWTAPQASGTFRITAQSVADRSKSAVATATVSAAMAAISIEPTQVTLSAGGPEFQFKAHVTGSADTAVIWSVEEPAGLASIDAAGVFKPPPDQGIFHIVVTSHADPRKTATAVVKVAEDLIDHGGPVAPATRTYALWWGDMKAFAADARTALETMLRGMDGSSYLGVADQYMRGGRATTSFTANLLDSTAPPADPTSFVIQDGACRAFDSNGIVPRAGDLVFMMTSNFPAQSPLSYCGYHGWTTCHGQAILFAYIPNAVGSPCESPSDFCNSGYSGATLSLLTIGAHELMESITDPFGDAWHGRDPWELADRCGSPACVPLSSGTFELPQLYSNAKHACVDQ